MADTSITVSRGLLNLTVDVAGEDEVTLGLSRMAEHVGDFSTFWSDYFAPRFYSDMAENFASEGRLSTDGAGWVPLSPAYERWKISQVGSVPGILEFTYALLDSLTSSDAPGSLFLGAADRLEIGTTIPYAAQHQHGEGRVPARPFMFVRNDDRYRQDLREWVHAQWRQWAAGGVERIA